MIRAFVVDDEELAVKRLSRLLNESQRVEVTGSSTDPEEALELLKALDIDVLFLDIQMPVLTGFDLLHRLDEQPLVVFTTAYDKYALQAFEVNSIDYLLKPIEERHLERALSKLERILGGTEPRPALESLLARLGDVIQGQRSPYPERIASRVGERVEFVDLAGVTHFYAKDKLTYAATPQKHHAVDYTIQELEEKLDPRMFIRIHRSTMVQLRYVHEMYTWFAGRMLVRLRDDARTELTVARDRVKMLKDRLGI